MYVSSSYDGNETFLQAEFYTSAPPSDKWRNSRIGKIDGNVLQHPHCWPKRRDTWEYVYADFKISQRTMHPEVNGVDDNGIPAASPGQCIAPQDPDTVRLVEILLTSSGSSGYILSTGISIEDVTPVGQIFHRDPDRDDEELKFSVLDDSGIFQVKDPKLARTAVLTVKPISRGVMPSLNYELNSLLSLTVRSEDRVGLTREGRILVHICDRNDPPVLMDTVLSVKEKSPRGTPVGNSLKAYDEDYGQSMKFSIEDGNFQHSEISAFAPDLVIEGRGLGKEIGSDEVWHDVLEWLVVGKFRQGIEDCCTGKSYIGNKEHLIGKTIFPRDGEDINGKTWKKWNTGNSGLINFQNEEHGGWSDNSDHVVAYAFTYIYSKVEQSVHLGICSDDGHMTWFNGAINEISNRGVCRSCGSKGRAKERVTLNLRRGENTLLVKVGQKTGGWNARVSFGSMKNMYVSTTRVLESSFSTKILSPVFSFSYATTGQLVVSRQNTDLQDTLDYETQNVYNLFVRVTDDGFGLMSDTAQVQVFVEDVNEPPRVDVGISAYISENVSPSYAVSTVIAFDEDPSLISYEVFPSSIFTISTEGVISLSTPKVINYEDKSLISVLVVVTDKEDLVTQKKISVHILDANDKIVMENQIRSIAENSGVGTLIGSPLETWDEDSQQTSRFRIRDEIHKQLFSVNHVSGQLYVGLVKLNWESVKTYSIIIDADRKSVV